MYSSLSNFESDNLKLPLVRLLKSLSNSTRAYRWPQKEELET